MNELQHETLAKHPTPPANALEALAHALSIYADTPDERFVITATLNIYGEGVTTGLTFGDLRDIAVAFLGLEIK